MKIKLNPYGKRHAAAARLETANPYRSAFIDRDGAVYIQTGSSEAGHWECTITDYDGLTEFGRAADEALREAVADQ